jgi:hypothetical protein
MKMCHFLSFRPFALLMIALGTVGLARAQYELQVSPYSRGFQGAKPDGLNPPTFTPQFAGQSVSMGASIVVGITVSGSTSTPVRPTGGSIRLLRSSFGGVVAPGVPRYAMGDVFLLPDAPNGVANYWRSEPVRAGETFSGVGTLQVPANFVPAYYYSPHAGRVFASQPGPVEVTWVTRGPVVVNGESTPRFVFYRESFAVTAAVKKPVRTLYWTERSFTAPTLNVPSGRIDQINPVFNRAFPATVSQEYQGASGAPTSAAGQPEEKRTVWFDRFAGIGQLHAYNREGRLMIEYLGAQQQGVVGDVYPFLGADIVDVIRVSEPVDYAVKLGNKLTPRNKVGAILPGDGTADWIAKPLTTTNLDGVSPYGSVTRRDGVTDYYAERENLSPERVAFYWMEKSDAGIHFLPAPSAPNLGLLWPKIRNHYAQIWSPELSDYAHNTVGPNGSTVATGIQFPGGQLPQVIFQDDPAQSEATIDALSQRLVVTFGSGSDGFNRALLKFSAANEVWYVPLYTQAENRPVSIAVTDGGSGYIAAPTVSFGAGVNATAVATITGGRVTGITLAPGGSGFLPGSRPGSTPVFLAGGLGTTPDARAATAMVEGFFEGDSLDLVRGSAVVGERINPPSSGNLNDPYLPGGYIASGRNYLPSAYRDPFTLGVVAAAQGAIIPVNAKPGENELKIWWLRKRAPDSAAFQTFYVPAKVGIYTTSYPTNPAKIVLASNAGSGDLSAAELAGSIYYENDSTKVGYNPNEEHALIKAGRVYALRDDLNIATGEGYSSEPFVLLSYSLPADSRPAMRAFKVVREIRGTANDIVFDYPVTAGSVLAAPMPLPLLPAPLDENGESVNTEVNATADAAPDITAPGHYSGFTYNDRKGQTWVYRGAHESADAGQLVRVDVKSFGFGYTSTPTVSITGGGGAGATAIAVIAPQVEVVQLNSGGQDYTSPPAITFPGGALTGGASAKAIISLGVRTVVVSAGGSGYTSAPSVVFSDGGSLVAQATATVANGRVTSISVTRSGTGYTSVPTVVLTGGGGTGASAIATPLGGPVVNIELTNPGAYSTSTPQGAVSFSGGGGKGAAAVALFKTGVVRVSVTNRGSGYTSAPAVNLTGGGGIGATAVAATTGPSTGMQFYYAMLDGFYVPGLAAQPPEGTLLPYLRPLVNGVPQGDMLSGEPLTIVYRPVWPANPAELRVAETLTLPKFGLPSVLSQSSAEVLYQQSVAIAGVTKPSVVLHDPIREKIFSLGGAGQLDALPKSIATTDYQGLTYFQGLPPHLQSRLFFDPNRGTKGALVLTGAFIDEIAGEDYLQLNVLSNDDLSVIKGLVAVADQRSAQWYQGIDSLVAKVETFVEDPLSAGSFISDGAPATVGPAALVKISNSDTTVVDYALTATGQGSGWVSMLFGNGQAFTPSGEPVSVGVFRVAPRLYSGDLKVELSSNPLDEQVSLRHSGDFAAKPQDYEFDWRYSPTDGGQPPTYSFTWSSRLAASWQLVQNPGGALPTVDEYAGALATTLPRGVQIKDIGFTGGPATPSLVARSTAGLDFSGGVPARILFSAALSDANAGFVLYVNGVAALAFKSPAPFTNAITTPSGAVNDALALQFEIDPSFFRPLVNQIDVALFTTSNRSTSSQIEFRLHATTETDLVNGPQWLKPTGELLNQLVVGGSPSAAISNPLLVLSDNYFTMRYRPRINKGNILATGTDQNAVPWSRWMPPKLVEGWIKRVLAGINPFNQRIGDLYNNAVNTDVSLLTQAGKRWEGNIALNLQNINNFGLIEIYETVLNRGKALSIENNVDYRPANDALLLAAGYLNDLYTLVGNEAFADAANPTISVDDSATATEVSTSRFSFEGQVKSVLEEELALLRGRDDFLSPGVTVAPGYNRLYWNYTRGINSGEALYAVNYNVREKAGSPTADGKLDAADAQRMFPQAHGDAYGHYLTALKGYTRLLQNPNFTWTPRSESVTLLGQAVQIDYFDERKFAAAAVNLGRTAQQVIALTQRQSYKDDPAMGWGHFRDGKFNGDTNVTRYWGLDEWTVRATQGAYFNWMLGNAMLPNVDNNPQHTGVQIIDRTTVPELVELTTLAGDFQAKIDSASAFLNPLGLSPNAIAFDISPTELKAGKSHFDQIYARSLRASLNAKGAFDQAARMTRLLRNQENQIGNYNDAIVDQELAVEDQLIEIYGTPYPGEVGPGKTYAQGYTGPDLKLWFIVDRPAEFIDTTKPVTIKAKIPLQVATFTASKILDITQTYTKQFRVSEITIQPDRYVQFSDQWQKGASMGLRRVTGKLQEALLDRQQATAELKVAGETLKHKYSSFERQIELASMMIQTQIASLEREKLGGEKLQKLRSMHVELETRSALAGLAADNIESVMEAIAEGLPTVNGIDNDVTSGGRSALEYSGTILKGLFTYTAMVADYNALLNEVQQEGEQLSIDQDVAKYGLSYEQAQVVYEIETSLRELSTAFSEIVQLTTAIIRADENVRTLIFLGDDIQADHEVFRKRAAAIIQGYRTKDVTFRVFRNEALEQYRSLYDLAGRYTYLAAKAYDYETGLLGSTAGQSVINGIVASRALGDLAGGVPQATVSTLGDSGLAGTMARLQADWAVAKPRLGINNPDTNGTLFSLRRELFRIVDGTPGDNAWQQTLEQHIMSNVMADSDVAAACRNLRKPDGSAVPGIVIPFSTTIQHGSYFFGLPSANGDHNFSPSNYATKIYSVGLVLPGYIGMDPYAQGTPNAGGPNTTSPNGLNATPYVYLIPTGTDYMLAPPLGDTGAVRSFDVKDQALPLPFNLGATAFSSTQFFNATGTLTEAPWILRKHQAFRPVSDPAFFYSTVPAEFTSSRLVGRSVWNGGWKLVIPAYTLLNAETDGLNRFAASVRDIQLFLRTYSHSGN